MKPFEVQTANAIVKFNLPTKLEEITTEYLTKVTDHITVAAHHSLIGVVYHDKLSRIIMTCQTKKKTANIGVIPIFIKAGDTDSPFICGAKLGQKLLIPSSSLQLANHVATPNNKLNLDYFAVTLNETIDKKLYSDTMTTEDGSHVMFVEFKIVPNVDIIAVYNDPAAIDNPYVTIMK